MTSWFRGGLLVWVGVLCANLGCWRANVFAITAESADAGGRLDQSMEAPDQSTETPRCPSPALSMGDWNEAIQVGSLSRSYVLHIPQRYDGRKPVPLILDFHGGGGSGASELSSSPYPEVTDPEGVVMVFPDGLKGPLGTGWNAGLCCVADVDDVEFARALVTHVQKTACIDPNRIYAVGVLNGGAMAYFLACGAADVFAGAAPAASDLVQENVDLCKPVRPISVISFRGTADPRVPYNGGAGAAVTPGTSMTFLGAKKTFARWADIDGCTGSASQEDNNGCSHYASCQDGVDVVLCTKQGGRDEPGDASIAWPLLKRHTL